MLDKICKLCYYNKRCRKTKPSSWEHSSAGRAPALQAGGHRFEPCCSHHEWPGSSAGQSASLSRQRSTVRSRSGSPFFLENESFHLPLQLSWQSSGLKIHVSLVRFRPEAPNMRMQLIWQSATLPRWRQRVRASSSAPFFYMAPQPSGKAEVCKTFMPQFKSGWCLHLSSELLNLLLFYFLLHISITLYIIYPNIVDFLFYSTIIE